MADPVVGFRVRILNPDGTQLTPGVDNADDAWEVWQGGGEQDLHRWLSPSKGSYCGFHRREKPICTPIIAL